MPPTAPSAPAAPSACTTRRRCLDCSFVATALLLNVDSRSFSGRGHPTRLIAARAALRSAGSRVRASSRIMNGPPWPSATEPVDVPHERHHRVGQRFGLVAVRRMSACRQLEQARLRDEPRDRVDLRHRSVFVILALHGQHRAADARKAGLDVPAAKSRVEPDVVPAVKRGIGIVVIARQPPLEIGTGVGDARLFDAGHADVLDEDVRRDRHDSRRRVRDKRRHRAARWRRRRCVRTATAGRRCRSCANKAGSTCSACACMKSTGHFSAAGRGVERP